MKQLSSIKHSYLNNPVGLYLFAFMIPINPKWLTLGILFIILDLMVRTIIFKQKSPVLSISFKDTRVWLILFFVLHIVGVAYTENTAFAWMDIGMKLSFILFPILFFLYPKKVKWEMFATYFIAGAIVSIMTSLIQATINYYERGYVAYFFDSRLSFMMHRSYWATYLVMASTLSWFMFYKRQLKLIPTIILFFVFSAFVFMSGSKMGILLLLLSTIIWVVVLLVQRKAYLFGILVLIFLAGIGVSVDYVAPQLSIRIKNGINSISGNEKIDLSTTESNASRILVWRSSRAIISDNFLLGVGTGDVKDELKKQNLKSGYTGIAELNMNAHNQFFNTHVAIGFFGLISLLLSFFTAFYIGIRKQIILLPILVTILFLSLLTESFFETQAGIIPGAFLLCLIGSYQKNETEN